MATNLHFQNATSQIVLIALHALVIKHGNSSAQTVSLGTAWSFLWLHWFSCLFRFRVYVFSGRTTSSGSGQWVIFRPRSQRRRWRVEYTTTKNTNRRPSSAKSIRKFTLKGRVSVDVNMEECVWNEIEGVHFLYSFFRCTKEVWYHSMNQWLIPPQFKLMTVIYFSYFLFGGAQKQYLTITPLSGQLFITICSCLVFMSVHKWEWLGCFFALAPILSLISFPSF